MTLVTTTNVPGLERFQALKDSAVQLSEECALIKVTDDTTEAIATQIISKARQFEKAVEDKRKELKAPILEQGKTIDNAAKYILDELSKSMTKAKKEILHYKEEQENLRLAELHRINQLKIKLRAYQSNTIEAIKAAKNTDELKGVFLSHIKPFPGPEVWQDINEEAQAVLADLKIVGSAHKQMLLSPEKASEMAVVQAEAIQKIEQTTEEAANVLIVENEAEKKTGLRTNWKFELVDITKVIPAFLTIDEAKVKAWMNDQRAGGAITEECVIHGIRFYPEKSLVIK
jgi:hypothetical protein